jgi:hypothetical protein
MAKTRKKSTAQPAAPEPPPMPLIGDKVTMPRSKSVLEINHVTLLCQPVRQILFWPSD